MDLKTTASSAINSNTLGFSTVSGDTYSCWGWWQDFYYPQVIRTSYPVYVQERAEDKGRKAFEIIKILNDKKLVKLDQVADFIILMDELIKIL